MWSVYTAGLSGVNVANKSLIAISGQESDDCLSLEKLNTDNLHERTFLGYIHGNMSSVTVYFQGKVFVIGGNRMDLTRRVSTFDIYLGRSGRVADLQIGRIGAHSATTSADEIYVCGGYFPCAHNSCEAFNSRKNVWTRLPNMRQGRESFALVSLSDLHLLATGGWNISVHVLSSCEMLEIASPLAAWRPVAPMRQSRRGHVGFQIGERVFVTGGLGLTSSEYFTPPLFGSTTEIGQWTCILSHMTRQFLRCTSLVVVSEKKIIIFGEVLGDNGVQEAVESFAWYRFSISEVANFGTWTWTPLPRISLLYDSVTIGVHPIN